MHSGKTAMPGVCLDIQNLTDQHWNEISNMSHTRLKLGWASAAKFQNSLSIIAVGSGNLACCEITLTLCEKGLYEGVACIALKITSWATGYAQCIQP